MAAIGAEFFLPYRIGEIRDRNADFGLLEVAQAGGHVTDLCKPAGSLRNMRRNRRHFSQQRHAGMAALSFGLWRHRGTGARLVTIRIYGIKSCDTMKKARAWLDSHDVEYDFHDYKASGIERDRLERWAGKSGWEMLLNRSGTTFRKLPDAAKAGLDEGMAIALMLAQPSMIKRPVLEAGASLLLVGFKPESYAAALRISR